MSPVAGPSCPRCAGVSTKLISPGFYECETQNLVGVQPLGPAGQQPIYARCGQQFQTVAGGQPDLALGLCTCGVGAIGRCRDCGVAQCGRCGSHVEGMFRCPKHAQALIAENVAARQRQEDERLRHEWTLGREFFVGGNASLLLKRSGLPPKMFMLPRRQVHKSLFSGKHSSRWVMEPKVSGWLVGDFTWTWYIGNSYGEPGYRTESCPTVVVADGVVNEGDTLQNLCVVHDDAPAGMASAVGPYLHSKAELKSPWMDVARRVWEMVGKEPNLTHSNLPYAVHRR